MTKHESKFVDLSLNIALYRKRKGLTQENLAELVNVSRTHISKIEARYVHTSLSLEKLFDIADALDVPPAKLLELRE